MDPENPGARPPALAHRRFQEHAAALSGRSLAEVFAFIYETNLWGSSTSSSGVGSEDEATNHLRRELPALLRRFGAKVFLDTPCGDFGWLSQTDLGVNEYIGADIVNDLVTRNAALYAAPGSRRQFLQCDLTSDPLPRADIVLCRDCLVHLPFAAIFQAFDNFKKSGSRYLLTTTFTELAVNTDGAVGDWRALNLEKPPFRLPPPLACIVEGCTEEGGAYADKALALWEIAALPERAPESEGWTPTSRRTGA
jgi:hypothetical protein